MATKINVYLTFEGNCEEAMNFYKDCLGGELLINRFEGTPAENQCPPEMKTKIMHSSLTKDDLILMGSDALFAGDITHGTSTSLALMCSSEVEIKAFFAKLSEGGRITEPLKEQFWGAMFGMLIDKYGFTWLLNYDKPTHS